MSERARRIVAIAQGLESNLLYLPKNETTKKTFAKQKTSMDEDKKLTETEDLERHATKLDEVDQEEQNANELDQKKKNISNEEVREVDTSLDSTDKEPFQSSGSEYVPDSSEDESELPIAKATTITMSRKCDEVTNKDSNLLRSIDRKIVTFGNILEKPSSKVELFINTRPWTKKNTCPYCFQDVTHFPRHLERNHKEEGAVKEFLAMSKKSAKQKELLNVIRRQGNFSAASYSKVIRPIRRPKRQANPVRTEGNLDDLTENYVLCPDCLGYFKRNYLRRHRKCCSVRNKSGPQTREQHLSAAQIFTICSSSHNELYSTLRLKEEVFPIMRNDEISKLAMKDVLICCYAESLLRRHKRTQIKNVISNKMRELGRLILALKNTTGLERLFDVLKPQFFDNFVSATKIISGYDAETHTFKAASLALHMGTTLKQVCNIATKMIIKKSALFSCSSTDETLKDIKRLRNLIEDHWNSEVSSVALKNLNENRYQKPKMLPLTENVMKFQKFVIKEAKEACAALKENHQIKLSYRRLSECVLALTLLLNRKRIGEIQYLKTNTYKTAVPQNQQEEFLQSLSETEKTLTKKFKRVVTEGKGSKPVAILFPTYIQKFIDALLSSRSLCVADGNEYLFANPNSSNRWLSGYHTLKKLAEESGVTDKSLFTSTRLRKQIATVLQVMNIDNDEMEQFANFMGHTRKTHESYYRLPQDVYQTAKVSKLLLAINKGKGAKYKGKTLDEIDFSNSEISESDDETVESNGRHNREIDDVPSTSINEKFFSESEDDTASGLVSTSKAGKPTIRRIRWTDEQKNVITTYFKNHIKTKTAPKKGEVQELMDGHKALFKNRTWVTIKAYVYNCYRN